MVRYCPKCFITRSDLLCKTCNRKLRDIPVDNSEKLDLIQNIIRHCDQQIQECSVSGHSEWKGELLVGDECPICTKHIKDGFFTIASLFSTK